MQSENDYESVVQQRDALKKKLLAYEQAAKNPAEYKVVSRFGDISLRNQKCEAEMYRSMKGFSVTPLYAAPVLPKQPEKENKIAYIKRQKALAWLKRVAYENPCMKEVKTCIEVLSAPAQPVIPEGLFKAINRLLDNDGSRGCFDALEQHRAKTELELHLAAAQQNVQQNIPAQPVSEPSNSPVIPDAYVLDELGRMTLNGVCEPRISFGSGWNACRDEMLKAQPVSEPYKLPDGWVMVPQQIFLDASDIESICSQCGDGHKSGYGDFTDGLLWVLPRRKSKSLQV